MVSSMSLIRLTPLGSMTWTGSDAERFSFARIRTWVGTKSSAARRLK